MQLPCRKHQDHVGDPQCDSPRTRRTYQTADRGRNTTVGRQKSGITLTLVRSVNLVLAALSALLRQTTERQPQCDGTDWIAIISCVSACFDAQSTPSRALACICPGPWPEGPGEGWRGPNPSVQVSSRRRWPTTRRRPADRGLAQHPFSRAMGLLRKSVSPSRGWRTGGLGHSGARGRGQADVVAAKACEVTVRAFCAFEWGRRR